MIFGRRSRLKAALYMAKISSVGQNGSKPCKVFSRLSSCTGASGISVSWFCFKAYGSVDSFKLILTFFLSNLIVRQKIKRRWSESVLCQLDGLHGCRRDVVSNNSFSSTWFCGQHIACLKNFSHLDFTVLQDIAITVARSVTTSWLEQDEASSWCMDKNRNRRSRI